MAVVQLYKSNNITELYTCKDDFQSMSIILQYKVLNYVKEKYTEEYILKDMK